MRTSTNGGASWGSALAPGGSHTGLGGQPVVLPNGDVVVPYESLASSIRSFRTTNGGTSWSSTVLVSSISHHTVAGVAARASAALGRDRRGRHRLRDLGGLPVPLRLPQQRHRAVQVHQRDHLGRPDRVPIDAVTSTDDHFIPGIAVDRSTSGATARIGLTYYYYPTASCTASTCQLDVGYISSINGGSTWSAATQLAGPMTLSWLPNTSEGRMFGDYISTSIPAGGNAYPILPIANAPTGSTFDLAMYVPSGGLAVTGGTNAATPARRAIFTISVRPAHHPANPADRALTQNLAGPGATRSRQVDLN